MIPMNTFYNTVSHAAKYVAKEKHISNESLRFIKVHYIPFSESLEFTATNGHVLYNESIEATSADHVSEFSMLLDAKAFLAGAKPQKKSGHHIDLDKIDKLYGDKKSLNYPNWEKAVPNHYQTELSFAHHDSKAFSDLLLLNKRIGACASKVTNLIKFDINCDRGTYVFSVKDNELCFTSSSDEHLINVKSCNNDHETGFNNTYLNQCFQDVWDFQAWHNGSKARALSAVPFKWGMNYATSATVMESEKTGSRLKLLIMPLRIYS